jgi:hypothetical protein
MDLHKLAVGISDVTDIIRVIKTAAQRLPDDPAQLLTIGKYSNELRLRMINNYLAAHCGEVVQSGPFEGMTIRRIATGSLSGPRLLGCYEQELHGLVRNSGHYRRLVNVGCAEGYYAVGFARLYPNLQVVAYDIDPVSRRACAELAELNGVASRIDIRAEFNADEMAKMDEPGTVVWMDIEGAEVPILDSLGPTLGSNCDWVIETHPVSGGNSLDVILRHFADTHDATIIEQQPRSYLDYEVLRPLGQLDRFMAQWEGRGPEPWVALTRRPGKTG